MRVVVVALLMCAALVGVVSVTAVDRTEEEQNASLSTMEALWCGHHGELCPTATATATATSTATATATATDTPSPTPTPTCDQIHASFVATGPDGNQYPTWHPMQVGNCTFGHEHGNDPQSVAPGFQPLYGYVNATHGMLESHHGFKTYAVYDQLTDMEWVVTQHQGTTTRNALCGRFHAINVVAFEDGVMKANLSIMGDFGQSRLGDAQTPLTPPECPGNPQIVSQGLRRIPTYGTSGGDGYTPYIINGTFSEIGLRIRVSFLTTNGRTGCPDVTCAELFVNENNAGDRRRFQTLGTESININQSVTTSNTGWFTDSTGVAQYIAPGFSTKLEVCRSERVANGSNGCWFADADGAGPLTKEQSPMRAAVDNNGFNGTSLGFPVAWLVQN
jgi:hypothetical protein